MAVKYKNVNVADKSCIYTTTTIKALLRLHRFLILKSIMRGKFNVKIYAYLHKLRLTPITH